MPRPILQGNAAMTQPCYTAMVSALIRACNANRSEDRGLTFGIAATPYVSQIPAYWRWIPGKHSFTFLHGEHITTGTYYVRTRKSLRGGEETTANEGQWATERYYSGRLGKEGRAIR